MRLTSPRTKVLRRCVLIGTVLGMMSISLPAAADDGQDSVGVVDSRTGIWYLRDPGTGETTSFYYGNPGDFPFSGDWDCDGVDTPGLYRQSNGYVYLRNSNSQGIGEIRFFFGDPGDIPIAGDFDGDGCDTVSIYRPSQGRAFVINELGSNESGLGAAEYSYYFGIPGDRPFVGDFDDDGIDTLGLHRESTGFLYFKNENTQGIADFAFFYGDPGDRIMAGNWAQTTVGPDTVGAFRPSNGTMYLRFSNTHGPADTSVPYGNPHMLPVAGRFGFLPGGGPDPPVPIIRQYSLFEGTEWKDLIRSGLAALPNLTHPDEAVWITGNGGVDSRIWDRAFERGYELRPVANGPLVYQEGFPMQRLAAEASQALQAEAASQGHSITVASAYRSITQQRSVFKSKLYGTTDAAIDSRLRYSAPPGASLHHTGYSLDFTEVGGTFASFGGSASFRWLSDNNYYNAKRFGFVPSYPPGVANGPVSEPWEYTFIGVDLIACGRSVGQPLEPIPDCDRR